VYWTHTSPEQLCASIFPGLICNEQCVWAGLVHNLPDTSNLFLICAINQKWFWLCQHLSNQIWLWPNRFYLENNSISGFKR